MCIILLREVGNNSCVHWLIENISQFSRQVQFNMHHFIPAQSVPSTSFNWWRWIKSNLISSQYYRWHETDFLFYSIAAWSRLLAYRQVPSGRWVKLLLCLDLRCWMELKVREACSQTNVVCRHWYEYIIFATTVNYRSMIFLSLFSSWVHVTRVLWANVEQINPYPRNTEMARVSDTQWDGNQVDNSNWLHIAAWIKNIKDKWVKMKYICLKYLHILSPSLLHKSLLSHSLLAALEYSFAFIRLT